MEDINWIISVLVIIAAVVEEEFTVEMTFSVRMILPVSMELELHCCDSWRRGSVVRASVSDWRTFPDMRLIYG